ncbi:hypothetical protein [Streptomyces venezuelae]|uniref:hypothetical protein n=1 Tax=Streptomyces venezuelae TaxID=54571 RepID=UPI00278C66F2|nr:hypothetical protein [Streptomyces venezuelae]
MHRHEGPPPRKFVTAVAIAVLLGTAATGVLIATYDERPPWATDIAYEGGYLQAVRIAKWRALRAGECADMERQGMGGARAAHDPAAWVDGCLDGAAGRPSRNQGIVR